MSRRLLFLGRQNQHDPPGGGGGGARTLSSSIGTLQLFNIWKEKKQPFPTHCASSLVHFEEEGRPIDEKMSSSKLNCKPKRTESWTVGGEEEGQEKWWFVSLSGNDWVGNRPSA